MTAPVDLAGRVVVVTGASAGIGAALAERLAALGARPVLVARRADALEAVRARCGDAALAVVADMTRRADAERVVATVLAEAGRLDAWVNNVGRGITRAPSALTEDDVDAMMRVNVTSALLGMQAVLPHFRAEGRGHVVNVSSMLGRIPSVPMRSAYSAAKHTLNALTIAFRAEVQATHPDIAVSLVSPGVVYTTFGANALHGGPDSRDLPGGQTPEEVAGVITDVLRTRAPDVYTRAGHAAEVAAYYATLGTDPRRVP